MKYSAIVTSTTEQLVKNLDFSNKIEVKTAIGTVANSIESLLNPIGDVDYDELNKLNTLYAALKAAYDHRYSK